MRLTPRRVLWLAGVCLLLLPAFACGAGPAPSADRDALGAHRASCIEAVRSVAAVPLHKTVDDNKDDESDDLIGDTWLVPCDMPARAIVDARSAGRPGARQLQPDPTARSFTAFDPFVPRPPPSFVQL